MSFHEDMEKLQAARDEATFFAALAAKHHLAALAYLRRAERLWKGRRVAAAEDPGHPVAFARDDVARAEGKLLGRLFRMEELSLELRVVIDAYVNRRAAA